MQKCIAPAAVAASLANSAHRMQYYPNMHTKWLLGASLIAAGSDAWAQGPASFGPGPGASTALPAITVIAPRALEAEPTDAASEKRFSGETLNTRPVPRPGEMLEATPGLIVTQHSGEGKANQYFLRGM